MDCDYSTSATTKYPLDYKELICIHNMLLILHHFKVNGYSDHVTTRIHSRYRISLFRESLKGPQVSLCDIYANLQRQGLEVRDNYGPGEGVM